MQETCFVFVVVVVVVVVMQGATQLPNKATMRPSRVR